MKLRKIQKLINESAGEKAVPFSNLPIETANDIAINLYRFYEPFSDYKLFWNSDSIREDVQGVYPDLMVYLRKDPVDKYYKFVKKIRDVSNTAVDNYTEMIESGVEFDPIIVNDGKFVDGAHRVFAYAKADKKRIPVVDIRDLANYDWDDYFDFD